MRLQTDNTKKQTIFRKLLTGYISITMLVVMLTALVSFFLVRQYTLSNNQYDLQTKAQTLAEMIALPGGRARWLVSSSRLREIQSLTEARFAFINPDKTLDQQPLTEWPGSEGDWPSMEKIDVMDTLDEDLIQSLLDGETITDVRKLDFMNDEVVFAGAPVINMDHEELGAVLLYRPLREVSATTQRIILMLVLAALVALVFACILAYFMGKKISRPLVLINVTAKHIADGNYGERVDVFEKDEVGQLGDTLNFLSTRLSIVIQNLSEEKSKLTQVLLSIGEGVIAIDKTGNVVHVNPVALDLLGLPEWQGSEDARFTNEHQSLLLTMLRRSMDSGERCEAQFTKDQNRTMEAICSPVRGEDQQILGAVCLIRDVSEAQRLEQMRRDYIANISHELRTPLTGIRGMVEPLLDGILETEQEKEDCYQIIYQETLRLERLIGEMLDLSRLQDGRIQMELEPMEIKPLLQAASRRLSERTQEASVRLLIDAPDDLRVMGNENRIIQVLIILMDNALSFTPPDGSITLGASATADAVSVWVSDTGAGINPEDLPYIWERFYKADKARLGTKGVGLGLAIAKLIVELMGGRISVVTQLQKGTTFTFTLGKS